MKSPFKTTWLPLISLLILGILYISEAQISAYQQRVHVLPYRSLSLATNASKFHFFDDYVYQGHVAIGFSFRFNGKIFDSLTIHENGFVTFGNSVDYQLHSSRPLTQLMSHEVEGLITAMGTDLAPHQKGSKSKTEILSKSFGQPGQRIFVVEWRKTSFKNMSTFDAGMDTLNFQIQLYEKNNGIRIHYGPMILNGKTDRELEIGIRGHELTDVQSLFLSPGKQNWSEATISNHFPAAIKISSTSFPPDGLVIEWKPTSAETTKAMGNLECLPEYYMRPLKALFTTIKPYVFLVNEQLI